MNRLRWLLCLCLCLVLPGLALARPPCRPHEPVLWQALAPGIWVWAPEPAAEVSPANGGHVMPVTALVHRGQALVIDPGPSLRHGLRLRDSLACRFGARVTRVVNSHAHSENVLANAAFEADVAAGRVRIEALAGTSETMAQRCPACLESLTGHAGALAMAGTRIVLPTHSLVPGQVLRFGPHRLQVRPAEQGHTASDLVLWSPRERILWAGGLVYGQRLPELAQGRLDDWLAALDRLAALHPATVVGVSVSRAPAAGALPPALLQTREYLAALREGVWRAMDAGEQPQTTGLVDLPAYRDWPGYVERHEFNRLRAWRELEPLWMGQGSDDAAPAAAPSTEQVGR